MLSNIKSFTKQHSYLISFIFSLLMVLVIIFGAHRLRVSEEEPGSANTAQVFAGTTHAELINIINALIAQLRVLLARLPAQNISTPLSPTTISVSNSETINTLDYFLNTHTQKTLTGSHPLSQTVKDQTIYYVKWAADSYETYTWDNDYIYLKEDHSGSPNPGSNSFSNSKWLKRSMKTGEQIDASDNLIQNFKAGSCTPLASGASFPYKVTLEKRDPTYNLGGDLGIQDVIIIRYDYLNPPATDYEKSYYAKDWGWVKWELYHNGQLIQTSTFNKVSTANATAPDLTTTCIDVTPVTPATSDLNTPTFPTSLKAFVSTLYSCVLNNTAPDKDGFNYWFNNLETKALTIPDIYKYFFSYQSGVSPSITNEQFTKKLYGCILFRPADDASYNDVMSDLSNNTLNQTGLVQTVLKSPEFNNGIFPKLQKLIP